MNDFNDGSVLLSVPESHSIVPAGLEMAHLNAIQLLFFMLLITSVLVLLCHIKMCAMKEDY